jgi:hypothetical protein
MTQQDMEMDQDMNPPDLCEGPACSGFEAFDDCPRVRNLGTIQVANGTIMLEDSTAELGSSVDAACTADGAQAADYVYVFQVDQPAFVSTTLDNIGQVDWAVEARRGQCTANTSFTCEDSGQTLFLAEPGQNYFFVLEPFAGTNEGPFRLNVGFTPLTCSPPGSFTCDMNDRVLCQGGTMERALSCGVACEGTSCVGDTCATAVPVMGSAGTYTFEGTMEAFTNNVNTIDLDLSCTLPFMGMPQLSTPGPEIFYRLQGLRAGQTVTIDAREDSNDDAIYILSACPQAGSACIDVNDLSDRLIWQVTDDGDYIVVVDVTVEQGQPYKHIITISD